MGFFLTCLYVVFLLLRPQEWLLTDYMPDNSLDIIVIMAMSVVTVEVVRGKIQMSKLLPHFWLMSGFFAAVLLADIAMTNFSSLLINLPHFGKIYVGFILVLLSCNTTRRIRIVNALIVGVALLVSLHCYLQVKTGTGFADAPPLILTAKGVTYVRAQYFGIMGDPNDTALYLTFALPLTFALFKRRSLVNYLLQGSIPLVLAYGVVLTQSRGGYLAMAVMVFFALVRYVDNRKFFVALVVAAMGLLVVLPTRLSALGIADQERTMLWGEANQVFKEHPLTGVGAQRIKEYMEADKAVHNSYINVYAEIGIIGYTFWLGLLAFSIYGSWKVSRLKPDDEEDVLLVQQAKGMFASLVGFAGAAYFLSRSYFTPLYVLLALSASMYQLAGLRVGVAALNVHCKFERKKAWWYPALSCTTVVLLYIFIRLVNMIG